MEDINAIIEKWESHGLLDDSKNKKKVALGFEVLYNIALTKTPQIQNRYGNIFPIYKRVIEKYEGGNLDLLTITYVVNYLIENYEKFLKSDQAKQLFSNIYRYNIDVESEMNALYIDNVDIYEIIKKSNDKI